MCLIFFEFVILMWDEKHFNTNDVLKCTWDEKAFQQLEFDQYFSCFSTKISEREHF